MMDKAVCFLTPGISFGALQRKSSTSWPAEMAPRVTKCHDLVSCQACVMELISLPLIHGLERPVTPITEEVLASIRKLIRASDVYSSKVRQLSGLTSAQLLLLRAVDSNPSASLGELARKICLSQATTSTILKRLESAGFTYTTKSENDRRRSQVFLTESGAEALVRAPKPLDQEFLDRFASLKPYEQSAIVSSLQRVAEMMGDDASADSDVA